VTSICSFDTVVVGRNFDWEGEIGILWYIDIAAQRCRLLSHLRQLVEWTVGQWESWHLHSNYDFLWIVDAWMDGWMDGWMVGWLAGRVDWRTFICGKCTHSTFSPSATVTAPPTTRWNIFYSLCPSTWLLLTPICSLLSGPQIKNDVWQKKGNKNQISD